MKFKCVIFDLGSTLISTKIIRESRFKFYKKYFPNLSLEKYITVTENARDDAKHFDTKKFVKSVFRQINFKTSENHFKKIYRIYVKKLIRSARKMKNAKNILE